MFVLLCVPITLLSVTGVIAVVIICVLSSVLYRISGGGFQRRLFELFVSGSRHVEYIVYGGMGGDG